MRTKTTSANYACGGVTGHATDCDQSVCFRVAGTARERRDAFMQAIKSLVERKEWQAAYDAVVKLGPSVGRTDRWLSACEWFIDQRERKASLSWIVAQGSVWLAHANS